MALRAGRQHSRWPCSKMIEEDRVQRHQTLGFGGEQSVNGIVTHPPGADDAHRPT